MSLTSRFHRILQKLLFLWVRVEVLPNPPISLPESDSPLLYLVEKRGLSDILVVEKLTREFNLPDPLTILDLQGYRHHSIYSVASRNPLSDWLMRKNKHSLMLEELLKALQKDETVDVQLLPVSIFWGRPLAKQRHWLTVLFSDTWEVASVFRRLLTILVHGRNTTVIFSGVRSLRTLCNQQQIHTAEDLNQQLSTILQQQREATFGPEITSRAKMISQVIEADSVRRVIESEAESQNKDTEQLRNDAIRYSQEVLSDTTQISQDLMKRLLNTFWNRFYSGIELFGVEQLKKTALTHQLVYVPCHRSHIDYLLLSYVIFREGLALPYIAAGDNLNMPVIGKILKGGGAFFIRRSFKDNPLYSAVLAEYVNQLIAMGAPVEYFIEGGRSRTGRLLQPKLGMLSMTVNGWIKSNKKPLAFIPVYIGYEKLTEGKSYLGELFGQKKQKESLFKSLSSIFHLKGQFGKVTACFGKPIKLQTLLDSNNPDWQQQQVGDVRQSQWFRATVKQLSTNIMMEINRAAVVNPVNLIATVLLATPRQSIDQFDLIEQCKFYQQLILSQKSLNSVQLQDDVNEAEIKRIQHQDLIDCQHHPLGDIIHLRPENSALMSYYRNNTLHTLIIPSVIACCFINVRTIKNEKLTSIINYIYPFLRRELHLPWTEQELAQFIVQIIDFLLAHDILTDNGERLVRPDRNDIHFLLLTRLAHIAQPVLERYYMTFVVLWESGSQPVTEAALEKRCYLVAQKISMLYGINSPDFFDRKLFGHFIETMSELGFIEKNEQGCLIFQDAFNRINLDIRILLSVEVRSTILQLLNSAHPHDVRAESG